MYRRIQQARQSGGWGIIKLLLIGTTLAIGAALFYNWHTDRVAAQQRTEELAEQYQNLQTQITPPTSVGVLRQSGRRLLDYQKRVARADITPEQKRRLQTLRNETSQIYLQVAYQQLADTELIDATELLEIAHSMHALLYRQEDLELDASLVQQTQQRIQEAITEGGKEVERIVSAGTGLTTLRRAHRIVEDMAQVSRGAQKGQYQQIASRLQERIRYVQQTSSRSPATGQRPTPASPENQQLTQQRRELYIQKLQPSVATNQQLDSLYLEGPEKRRIMALGNSVSADELISWFMGSEQVRSQLVGLGFEEFVAQGPGETIGFHVQKREVLFRRGEGAQDSTSLGLEEKIQDQFPTPDNPPR